MKPVFHSKTSPQNKHTRLLIILVTNFVLAPFLQGIVGRLFSSAISLYAIIIIVQTFSLNQKLFRLYVGIAALAFGLEAVARFGWYSLEKASIYFLFQDFVYAVCLGMATFFILRDVLSCQHITGDTIRGGICAYLLIGFFWALLYAIVANFDEGAFSQTADEVEFYNQAIHFSFTTLTTLGYGDIVPLTPLATMLTNLEAIIGQLYPSTLIAVLVGNYTSERTK